MSAPLFTETTTVGDERVMFRTYNLPMRTDGYIYVEGEVRAFTIKIDQSTIWMIVSGLIGLTWFYGLIGITCLYFIKSV